MATVTGTVDEKDGVLSVGEGDKAVRYVKESDLLAVKGSRVAKEDVAKEVEAAKLAALAEVNPKLEAEHQKAISAEARIQSLQEQIKSGGGTAAEVADLKQKLVTAEKSGEVLGTKYLEMKRDVVMKTYNVPKATVEKKTLAELEVFEEALKAVVGNKGGNYAAGSGGGGTTLTGTPYDLAKQAYSSSNSK